MPDIKLLVEPMENGRLDQYITEHSDLSRSAVQKLIKDNIVTVNGSPTRSSYKVLPGDIISFFYEESIPEEIMPADIPLDIIYEDDDVIVINKQKGLVVHPAPGNYDNTLVNALLFYQKKLSDLNGQFRPGIVHRIDKDTSGLLVIAKNNNAHAFLAEQLKDKTCYRKYYALVQGVIANNEGVIDAPIGRSEKDRQKMAVKDKNSKDAITEFTVLERYYDSSLLDVNLLTGRTHQIRVHMAFIHHPIINDDRYRGPHIDDSGQFLHAYELSFIHPSTKERMTFKTDMPIYMKEYINSKGGSYGKQL